MKIYEAAVAKFSEINKMDLKIQYEIRGEDYKIIRCIKDDDYMYDIKTCERYYILKRTNDGFISPDEMNNISLDNQYIISNVEFLDITPKILIDALKTKKYILKKRQNIEKTKQKLIKR